MALDTYANLQSSIADNLHRSDLTTIIPDFITLAERRMNKDLKSRDMEARITLSTVSANAYVTIPIDIIDIRRLMITSTDPKRTLKYKTPDELTRLYSAATYQGTPVNFTVIGSEIQFGPIPDTTYTLEMSYKQGLPALSSANTTNWLLTKYPDAYLYASLLAAQGYVKDDSRLNLYHDIYKETVDSINKVDWYTGTTMTVSYG